MEDNISQEIQKGIELADKELEAHPLKEALQEHNYWRGYRQALIGLKAKFYPIQRNTAADPEVGVE